MNEPMTPLLFVKWVLALFLGFNLVVVTIAFVAQLFASARERREQEKVRAKFRDLAAVMNAADPTKLLRPKTPLAPPGKEEKSDA